MGWVRWLADAPGNPAVLGGKGTALWALLRHDHWVVERSTWTAANIQEVLPGVLTPLTWSLLREQWRHAYHTVFLGTHTLRDASVEFVALFYNRPFLNVSALCRVAARALGTSPAGLVVDVGGPLSHGAIVARTGQTITINGATGEVWVE